MANFNHIRTFSYMTIMALIFLFGCLALVSCETSHKSAALTVQENKQCPLFKESTESIFLLNCKKCHQTISTQLKNDGGKHSKISCSKCHIKIQQYIPGKTKFKDIKPTCGQCHKPPHGEKLTECTSCHQVAHAPQKIPVDNVLADACYICHEKLDKEMKTFITQHTEMFCTACHHSKHRYKPSCLECHQPHKGTFPAAGPIKKDDSLINKCLTCHPPHKALKVEYPADTPNGICIICHRKPIDMLTARNTKHTALQCSLCHPEKHRTIKRCNVCHGTPHTRTDAQAGNEPNKFNNCSECHGIAHNVTKPEFSPQTACGDCHEKKTAAYAAKKGLWIHGPVTKSNCSPCHYPHQSDEISPFKHRLTVAAEKICVMCHVEGLLRLTKSHQESTKCLQCHNPHLGKNPYLLIRDYKEVRQFPDKPTKTN